MSSVTYNFILLFTPITQKLIIKLVQAEFMAQLYPAVLIAILQYLLITELQ